MKPITPPPTVASMPSAEGGRLDLAFAGGAAGSGAGGRRRLRDRLGRRRGRLRLGLGLGLGRGCRFGHRLRFRLGRGLRGGRLRDVAGGDEDDAGLLAGQRDVVSFTVAERHDPVGLDAAAEQVILGGVGALLAQPLVRGRAALLVRVALEAHRPLLTVLQPGRDAGQTALAVLVDLGRAADEGHGHARALALRRPRRFSLRFGSLRFRRRRFRRRGLGRARKAGTRERQQGDRAEPYQAARRPTAVFEHGLVPP
jgi:hypothetical protein